MFIYVFSISCVDVKRLINMCRLPKRAEEAQVQSGGIHLDESAPTAATKKASCC